MTWAASSVTLCERCRHSTYASLVPPPATRCSRHSTRRRLNLLHKTRAEVRPVRLALTGMHACILLLQLLLRECNPRSHC